MARPMGRRFLGYSFRLRRIRILCLNDSGVLCACWRTHFGIPRSPSEYVVSKIFQMDIKQDSKKVAYFDSFGVKYVVREIAEAK